MQKDKLKELIKQCLSSVLDEESASGDAGGYLGIKAFKPKYEGANTVFNRNPARTKTSQDTNSPAGFESMPDSGKVYIKSGFKVVKPSERIDAKDLWKGNHLEERIAVLVPQAFRKPKKQHETSKSGHEDLPNPDKYFELVKFKIVDPKEEPLNEGVDMGELQDTLKRVKKENPGKKVGYSFIQDAPKGYKISIDGKYVNESVNESDMDAKLPKDLLIQVVEALIIQVITQASTRKINIPASDIESLRNNLKKEINSGKITTVGQIMKTIQKLHPMRESVRKGVVKEARLRRQGNGGQLNELGILGSAIAIALGLTGAYALIKGSSWVKEKLGDASYDLLKKLDTQLKAKKAIEDKAQLMDTIKPMIDRLSEDAKLKQLYAELPEWGSSISKRQTKINAERAKQLRKIGEYIKSKLTEDEAKYFSAISQFFRKGTLDELIKEAAFRTLFTHPIWKKAGVNYVDSNFVNDCKNKIPLSDLVHLGMGDFMLKTPHGDISFDRVSYQFDGMSGWAHKMTGNKQLMDMLIKKMRAQVVHSESVNKSIKKKINEWSSNDVLALLGGKRFLATSGAYAMSGNVAQKTAKFNFKTSGKNGINNVWITETSPDTYTINFIKVEGEDVNISPIKNVSGDKLKSIFTKYTGLKTP